MFDKDIFDLLARREEFIGEYFCANSVKVFVDGVIETHTSNMLEPYIDTGENFPPFYSQSELNDYYQKFDAMGVQIHTSRR